MTDKELYKKFSGKKVIEPIPDLQNICNLTADIRGSLSISFNLIRNPDNTKALAVVLTLNGKDINRFTLPPQGAKRLRDCLIEYL